MKKLSKKQILMLHTQLIQQTGGCLLYTSADADDYTYEALKLFLLGAISRAFQPGCKFEIMLLSLIHISRGQHCLLSFPIRMIPLTLLWR